MTAGAWAAAWLPRPSLQSTLNSMGIAAKCDVCMQRRFSHATSILSDNMSTVRGQKQNQLQDEQKLAKEA